MPSVEIVKFTNGQDANTAGSGPNLAVGATATFTYTVRSTGGTSLQNVVVTDDNGTPGNTADDFTPTRTGGDTNSNNILETTETWTYTATRTVTAGQYTNIGRVTAEDTLATQVTDSDPEQPLRRERPDQRRQVHQRPGRQHGHRARAARRLHRHVHLRRDQPRQRGAGLRRRARRQRHGRQHGRRFQCHAAERRYEQQRPAGHHGNLDLPGHTHGHGRPVHQHRHRHRQPGGCQRRRHRRSRRRHRHRPQQPLRGDWPASTSSSRPTARTPTRPRVRRWPSAPPPRSPTS